MQRQAWREHTATRVASLVLACALLSTACASDMPDPVSNLSADEAPSALAAANVSVPRSPDAVTLQVTAWKGNEAEPAGLPQLIEAFEAEHVDIDIELTYVSRLDSDVILTRQIREGDPPDVMMTDMPLAQPLIDDDLLINLDTDSEWHGRIPVEMRDILTASGEIYIMPIEMIGMGNFVNLTLLEQAGIEDPPATIEQLKDACRRLDAAGIKPMIFTGGLSASLFVIANGLEGTDNTAATLGSGEAKFADDPSFLATMAVVRDLVEARCFNPTIQAGMDPWSTALTTFREQRVAMMPQGAWNIAAFEEVEGLEYAFAPIPSAGSEGMTLDLFGFGWSIPTNGDHREAARTFVEWSALPLNVKTVLDAEAAYTPFDDGSSGTPARARPYDEARNAGAVLNYPVATLAWPKELETEIWDSLTAFLLDTSISGREVLERWDAAVLDIATTTGN